MLNPGAIPAIDPEEVLARFVFSSRNVRADNSIKADAFIPHPNNDLSLTRHRDATDIELWSEGQRIGIKTTRPLHGRADVPAIAFNAEGLTVHADPDLPENPNHAIVLGWPTDKPAQKIIAVQIANKATYLAAN